MVESGNVYLSSLATGDKFKDDSIVIYDAKRFEADVALVFRACEKTQLVIHLRLTKSACKNCATEIKEYARH